MKVLKEAISLPVELESWCGLCQLVPSLSPLSLIKAEMVLRVRRCKMRSVLQSESQLAFPWH